MKNNQIVIYVVMILLLTCISCCAPLPTNRMITWRMYFCVPDGTSSDVSKSTLLKTGVEVTDQDEINSYLSLLESAESFDKKGERHFCGFETAQVFESNSVPVFVTSISGCGYVRKNKILQVDKFEYGYYIGKLEGYGLDCLPYSVACHQLFEDAVKDMSEHVIQTYSRNRRCLMIKHFGCKVLENKDEVNR